MIRAYGYNEFMYLVAAAQWTVALSLIGFVGGAALGLVLAAMRTSRSRVLRGAAFAWITLFQCVPLLTLLFLVFFGLAFYWRQQNPYIAVTIALSLYAGAYLGEIWRGAVEAVPKGQMEGAAALGLPRLAALRLVIWPQAVRLAVPPTVGFLVQLIKNTSLASIIGFTELAQASQFVNNLTFKPIPVYQTAAAIYFALCFPLTWAAGRLERVLSARVGGPARA